jgi:hypothetical protein
MEIKTSCQYSSMFIFVVDVKDAFTQVKVHSNAIIHSPGKAEQIVPQGPITQQLVIFLFCQYNLLTVRNVGVGFSSPQEGTFSNSGINEIQ